MAYSGDSRDAGTSLAPYCAGDRVRVRFVQSGLGGSIQTLYRCEGNVGTVLAINLNGDAIVEFVNDTRKICEILNVACLTKIKPFLQGDRVKVIGDRNKVGRLQHQHGLWSRTASINPWFYRNVGRVTEVEPSGNLVVLYDHHGSLTLHPDCCTLLPAQTDSEDTGFGLGALFSSVMKTYAGLELYSLICENLVSESAKGNVGTVRQILRKGQEPVDTITSGSTALQIACKNGHGDVIDLLLLYGATLDFRNSNGETALHYAVSGNRPEITETLIEKGADLNLKNNNMQTALHIAARSRSPGCVKILLHNNADINAQDVEKRTALHDAIGVKNEDTIDILLNYPGIDLSKTDKDGSNMIMYAAWTGNVYATRQIIQKFPQYANYILSVGEKSFSPLHIAALLGHTELGDVLISIGKAYVNVSTNPLKLTPLHMASERFHHTFVELLVRKGARVNVTNFIGSTPLHLILAWSPIRDAICDFGLKMFLSLPTPQRTTETQAEIACLLVREGADTVQKDHNGKTPLDLLADGSLRSCLRQLAYLRLQAKTTKEATGGDNIVENGWITLRDSRQSSQSGGTNETINSKESCSVDQVPTGLDLSRQGSQSGACGDEIDGKEACSASQGPSTGKKGKRARKNRNRNRKKQQQKVEDPSKTHTEQLQRQVEEIERSRANQLEKRVEEMESANQCVICMDKPKNVAFLCGHTTCKECADTLQYCPICRKRITQKIVLF